MGDEDEAPIGDEANLVAPEHEQASELPGHPEIPQDAEVATNTLGPQTAQHMTTMALVKLIQVGNAALGEDIQHVGRSIAASGHRQTDMEDRQNNMELTLGVVGQDVKSWDRSAIAAMDNIEEPENNNMCVEKKLEGAATMEKSVTILAKRVGYLEGRVRRNFWPPSSSGASGAQVPRYVR